MGGATTILLFLSHVLRFDVHEHKTFSRQSLSCNVAYMKSPRMDKRVVNLGKIFKKIENLQAGVLCEMFLLVTGKYYCAQAKCQRKRQLHFPSNCRGNI